MTKKWQKKIESLPPKIREELLIIVKDVIALHVSGYDVIALQGFSGRFRVRKGKIRIIFQKIDGRGVIQKIDFRGDVYKSL